MNEAQSPEEFSAWAFGLMRNFPTAPMHLQLSEEQVHIRICPHSMMPEIGLGGWADAQLPCGVNALQLSKQQARRIHQKQQGLACAITMSTVLHRPAVVLLEMRALCKAAGRSLTEHHLRHAHTHAMSACVHYRRLLPPCVGRLLPCVLLQSLELRAGGSCGDGGGLAMRRCFDALSAFLSQNRMVTEKFAIVQIEELHAAYMPEAVAMAEGWRRGGDIAMPYTMLWAIAMA